MVGVHHLSRDPADVVLDFRFQLDNPTPTRRSLPAGTRTGNP